MECEKEKSVRKQNQTKTKTKTKTRNHLQNKHNNRHKTKTSTKPRRLAKLPRRGKQCASDRCPMPCRVVLRKKEYVHLYLLSSRYTRTRVHVCSSIRVSTRVLDSPCTPLAGPIGIVLETRVYTCTVSVCQQTRVGIAWNTAIHAPQSMAILNTIPRYRSSKIAFLLFHGTCCMYCNIGQLNHTTHNHNF